MPKRRPNYSGGPNAPRLPNRNIDWKRVLKEHLIPVLDSQKAPNTIRGLMYILKSKGILKKTDYNVLDLHLVDWRLAGHIRWNQIADGSGRGIIGDYGDYEEPDEWINKKIDFLKNATEEYHNLLNNQWRWFGQPKYVVYMTEKQAVTGTIHAYVKNKYVKLSYNRGNNGWGWAYRYSRKLKRELNYYDIESKEWKPRKEVFLGYLGDDDNYGRHMDIELQDQLREFGSLNKIRFERIAVLPKHVKEYGIPRSDEGGGYDIDALNAYRPDLFEKLLINHINKRFDEDIHDKVLKMYPKPDINKLIRKRIKFLTTEG